MLKLTSRLVVLAAVSLAVTAPAAGAASRGTQPVSLAAGDPVPGEVLVGFDRSATGSERAAARRAAGVSVKRALRITGVQLVEVRRGESTGAAIARLERDPSVRYAEPNRWRTAAAVPNDPLFGQLWGMQNLGQSVNGFAGTPDADIDATDAWDVFTGGDTLVAVVDEGVAYDHPDLAPNMWSNPREVPGNGLDDDGNGFADDVHGADFVDGDGDPRDFGGHGTHVAGTIAAAGNNGQGVAGVSWSARLMAVRALGPDGGSDADVASAFDYAGDNGARIVNASLGGPGGSDTMEAAIAGHPGTLFVVAAGNDGSNNDLGLDGEFPCNFTEPNLICVAATTQNDSLADFSNFGTSSVDLGAPGTNILSAAPDRGDVRFGDGFEANDFATRWNAHVDQGTTSAWGRTGASAATGAFSMADSPSGNYANLSNSYADLKTPLNLSGLHGCQLNFNARLALLPGDVLAVDRSLDGGANWQRVFQLSASTGGTYQPFTADLNAEGASSVLFGFGIETSPTGTADGVNVDDVSVGCIRAEQGAGDYVLNDGTSMATPAVAGAAALLIGRKPSLTVAQVRSLLLDTGDPLPALAGKTVTGRRLNVNNAIRNGASVPDPEASTGAATAVSPTGATLGGTVNPRTAATSWQFEYGTTTAYGSSTALTDAGAGNAPAAVSSAVAGLTASTLYHFRLVAVRGAQRFPAADATFTTAAAPPPPRPSLRDRIKHARVACTRKRGKYRCRVVRAGSLRVSIKLKHGKKVVGRGKGRAGKVIKLRGPKAKKGRYKITLTFSEAGKKASITKRIRVR